MKTCTFLITTVAVFLGLLVVAPYVVSAADASMLKAALTQMATPQLDRTSGLEISRLTLEQPNFSITLESGTFYFFQPLHLDSADAVYGGFFLGRGSIHFAPPLAMERDQLRRFYNGDSLSKSCNDIMLLFNGKILEQLRQAGKPAKTLDGKTEKQLTTRFADYTKFLTIREDYSFLFSALRNIAHPRKQPYLLVSTELERDGQVFYVYDPYEREEVKFYRYFKQFVVPYFMENICSYSIYADTSYAMINGTDKSQIKPVHYTIDATINTNGDMTARTDLSYESQMQPVQLLNLQLHERLVVDSIRDSLGRPVEFQRWQKETDRSLALQVILPQPLSFHDRGRLSFYYHGDLVHQRVGEMYVDVRDNWYPIANQGYNDPANFDMTFRSPLHYGFVASGDLVDQKELGDTLLTVWRTKEPVFDASWDIGTFTRYRFTLKDLPIVDVFYLERLHKDSVQGLLATVKADTMSGNRSAWMRDVETVGKNMQEQVASDVIAALKTFTARFGPLPLDRLAAAEVLDSTRYGFIGQRSGASSLPGAHFTDIAADDKFSAENTTYRNKNQQPETTIPQTAGRGYKGMLFPGNSYTNLVLLRFGTFERTDDFGEETRYRANGVAAQWWRHSLSPETYHDEWLAAGLSEYSALVYLQASRGDNQQFLDWMGQFRADLLAGTSFLLNQRQAMGALALGPRAATTASRDDYELLMYRKGAFIFHMLRNMLLNLETFDESRFFDMLRDYYTTFKGRRVTTDDFRAIVEKHTGVDMKWFFDQWVYGTAIPSYKFSYKAKEAEGKGYKVQIRIEQKGVPETFKAYIPVEIEFDSGNKTYVRVLVDKPLYTQELSLESRPKKIRLNPFESVLGRVDQ